MLAFSYELFVTLTGDAWSGYHGSLELPKFMASSLSIKELNNHVRERSGDFESCEIDPEESFVVISCHTRTGKYSVRRSRMIFLRDIPSVKMQVK